LTDIKRLVLDVLKPHHPSIIEISKRLSVVEGVQGVNCTVYEMDQETESIKVTIEGPSINYDQILETIESVGAAVHSIDMVSAGSKLVEEVSTPQDKVPR
jgi:hypothetical protein